MLVSKNTKICVKCTMYIFFFFFFFWWGGGGVDFIRVGSGFSVEYRLKNQKDGTRLGRI